MLLLFFFVTQISQMTQIFLRGMVLSHRFHRFTQIFLRGIIFGHADFADDVDFSSWDKKIRIYAPSKTMNKNR